MRSTVPLVCVAAMAFGATTALAYPQVQPGQHASVASAAQKPDPQKPDPQKPDPQKPDPQKPDPKKPDPDKPEEPQRVEGETVVVTASRTEQRLINAPATMSVVTEAQIEGAPSPNFAELLRSVPGMNITQISARDINLTTRGSTGTLATGQLALLDGRSIYQDFFGFVMWDFLPVNLNEIKQIEVIRGPASAVWGANAFNGVVNVITKSPREMQGTSGVLGFGGFGRVEGEDAGGLWYVSGTHAAAVNDRWSYKLSAGGYSQDAFSRPTGQIPCDRPEACGTTPKASYPAFANQGTAQPKFDARVDYDWEDGRNLSFTGGVAGTDGIMHTGIGPFEINSGTVMAYGKAAFSKGALRAALFTNVLRGDAINYLAIDPASGQPIGFDFSTTTYDFEMSNVQAFAGRHALSYGGNIRLNFSDLSIAPTSDDRQEFGLFAQDEIFLSNMFRWVVGARVDRFDYIDDLVFSPRTTFMVKPQENHTFRVSYNRAYRSPSVINNHLDLQISENINVRGIGALIGLPPPLIATLPDPYRLPINVEGNPDLDEQSMDSFEVGYSAAIGRAVVSAAYYHNWISNEILFSEDTTGRYTPQNPPPGWPLPPQVIGVLPGGSLPGRFTYLNFGESTQQGFELGINSPLNQYFDMFVNYSWQDEPNPKDFPLSELNLPPTNRFNAGIGFNRSRYSGNLSVSYSDDAFWQDVLDARYSGTTDAYTLVNASFGVRWNDRFTTTIKAINLTDDDIQQHVFGDITKRQVLAELRVNFAR